MMASTLLDSSEVTRLNPTLTFVTSLALTPAVFSIELKMSSSLGRPVTPTDFPAIWERSLMGTSGETIIELSGTGTTVATDITGSPLSCP